MLFNSISFAVFFSVVLALHQLRVPWWTRKLLLVLASWVFYAAWNPAFVLLLVFSTVSDWWIAKVMDRTEHTAGRRGLLILSLVLNLGLLGAFKYADFLLEISGSITRALGIPWEAPRLGWVLPVGISFYTFQTLSYTIDVYRRELAPTRSLLDFSLFVGFFPQLVAGPIVRAREFLPQCEQPRNTTLDGLVWGLTLVILGLFQKVVLADTVLAPVSDTLFSTPGTPDSLGAWIGTLAFSGQIFCDFSGYSLCAIGIAGCLGFRLPDNFQAPYAALGLSDFWRRWHISLSRWLRDYLYVPLGGNRGGSLMTLRNLTLTMLLGGLWHGASWNFVLWGALHGVYLVLERVLRARFGHWAMWRTFGARVALGFTTLFAVCLAWVPFRARDLTQAWEIGRALFVNFTSARAVEIDPGQRILVLVVIAGLVASHWLNRERSIAEAVLRVPTPVRVAVLTSMLVSVLLVRGDEQAFLYFQF